MQRNPQCQFAALMRETLDRATEKHCLNLIALMLGSRAQIHVEMANFCCAIKVPFRKLPAFFCDLHPCCEVYRGIHSSKVNSVTHMSCCVVCAGARSLWRPETAESVQFRGISHLPDTHT